MKDEREVVLLALLSLAKNDTFSNVLVRRTLDSCADLSTEERAFIKRLLEGVIERKTELDALIVHYTGRSVSRLHPAIHQTLRMGLYQILYMDAVPDSAACNESVRLAKRHGPARLSGFVNGVLRNAARDAKKRKTEALPGAVESERVKPVHPDQTPRAEDPSVSISIRHSTPEWLVDMWTQQIGREETEALLEAFMEIRPVSARLCGNPSGEQRERLLEQIRACGAQVEAGRWLPDSIRLRRTSDLRLLPGFAQGLWTVQDESSMLAVTAAGLRGPETVYDVCAAPGGKSFYAADILLRGAADQDPVPGTESVQRKTPEQAADTAHPAAGENAPECRIRSAAGTVHAFDLTARKTRRIREGAERLHLDNILVGERDARQLYPEEEGCADVLLCDLPCSGLGVIGKKRDIKYRASREGIDSLQALQREILTSAVHYLRSGGVLLYTTCTISRQENEENAAWIEQELGLIPEDLAPYLPDGIPGIRGHMLQLLPHVHGTDGFFISRFRKG